MTTLADKAAYGKLYDRPMSIDAEDMDLYRALLDLELCLFRARIAFIVRGERSQKLHELIEQSGELYVKIKANLGGDPASTGSRRCRVCDVVPGRLLCGDPRSRGLLDGDRPRRAPARPPMGNDDRPQQDPPCGDPTDITL